jgi:hypothetical protein
MIINVHENYIYEKNWIICILNPVGSCSARRAKVAIRCITRTNGIKKGIKKNLEMSISHSDDDDDDDDSCSGIWRSDIGKYL